MAKVTITIILTLLFQVTIAQLKFEIQKHKEKIQFLDVSGLKFKNYFYSQSEVFQPFAMEKVGQNGLFDIYDLSLDNMPCLVPNGQVKPLIKNSLQYSITGINPGYIPNPFRNSRPFTDWK